MKKLFRLTQAGADELQSELSALTAQRGPLADRIRKARELGDLSENAEYQTSREEQDRLETRIGELEHVLQNMELIKKPKADGQVQLGSTVILKAAGKLREFQVVGTMEADPTEGKISDESPIGRALLGKKAGEAVKINASAGNTTYRVVEIR